MPRGSITPPPSHLPATRVPIPPPLSPPPLPRVHQCNHPRRRGWEGVTNQRLAIVNSTCAVKQLINKRLFTSCAHGVLARTQRTQRERIIPPRDDECGADNAVGRWTTRSRSGLKLKKMPISVRRSFTGW